MKFTKMQGRGNAFVVVDGPAELSADQVREICDRRRGIGADGILVIGAAQGRCWPVMIHNADGSLGESCGNGARCVARYLLDRHGGEALDLAFPGGTVTARRDDAGIAVTFAAPPSPQPVTLNGARGYRVSFGNPHVVLFVADPAKADLTALATGGSRGGRPRERGGRTHRRERSGPSTGRRTRSGSDAGLWHRRAQ